MRDHIELARRAFEAASRRPKPDFETVNALFHPDHVFLPVAPEQTEVKGGTGYRAWLADNEGVLPWTGQWEGAIEVGPHTVLCEMTMQFRGATSDIEIEQQVWVLITLADGKVSRSEAFLDPAAALAAAA